MYSWSCMAVVLVSTVDPRIPTSRDGAREGRRRVCVGGGVENDNDVLEVNGFSRRCTPY